MNFFYLIYGFVIVQRLLEVVYAKFNEKRMKQLGAIERGASHYKWIVLLHVLFFIFLLIEVLWVETFPPTLWGLFLAVFVIAQILRVWALASLGRFWNTKIIVLPGASLVRSGPYKWLPHPNYIVVAMEILSLPLIFGAWRTAVIFSIANAFILLRIRIPAEEKALQELGDGGIEKKAI